MNSKNNNLILTALFIFQPLLILPLLFYFIYQQKKVAYTLLAIFFGLLAVLYAPTHDLYRHTLLYYNYVDYPVNDFFIFSHGYDFVFYTMTSLFAKIGFNFEIVRFLFVTFSYLLYFEIFRYVLSNTIIKRSKVYSFILFLIFLFSIRFFVICCGLRQGFATALFIYSLFSLLFQNKKIGYLTLSMTPFIHFSFVFPVLLVLSVLLFNFYVPKKLFMPILLLLYVSSALLFKSLSDNFTFLSKNIDTYTTGYWGSGGEASHMISINGFIALFLNVVQIIPLVVIFYKYYEKSKYYSISFLMLCLVVVSLSYFSFLDRMIMLYQPLAIYYLIFNFKNTKLYKRCVMAVLLSTFSYFVVTVYAERDTIALSRFSRLFLSAPYTLMNSYDKVWLNIYIDEGNIK